MHRPVIGVLSGLGHGAVVESTACAVSAMRVSEDVDLPLSFLCEDLLVHPCDFCLAAYDGGLQMCPSSVSLAISIKNTIHTLAIFQNNANP